MSRKLILTLAAALFAATSLASQSADARGFGGGFGRGFGGARFMGGAAHRGHGGGRLAPIFGRGGHGGHGGRGGLIPIRGPRHPVPPIFWPGHHHHHWHHWVYRGGQWIVVDDAAVDTGVVDTAVPAADPAPGPCTCLIKTYTPAGLVVFSDMCTKEQASAPVNADTSDATQTPTSTSAAPMSPAQVSMMSKATDYDGRTYTDYLAANPGVAQALAQTAPQGPAPVSQPAPSAAATK